MKLNLNEEKMKFNEDIYDRRNAYYRERIDIYEMDFDKDHTFALTSIVLVTLISSSSMVGYFIKMGDFIFGLCAMVGAGLNLFGVSYGIRSLWIRAKARKDTIKKFGKIKKDFI